MIKEKKQGSSLLKKTQTHKDLYKKFYELIQKKAGKPNFGYPSLTKLLQNFS